MALVTFCRASRCVCSLCPSTTVQDSLQSAATEALLQVGTVMSRHRILCWNDLMLVQVLQRLGFKDSNFSKTARAQTRILLFNYWVTYCILKARKPSFQPMEPVAAA